MKTSTITLWENPQANFRLTLNTLYEKTKPDGTTQNKVYYNTQTEALNANAGVFLCFWYYVPEDFRASQAVFTASSHIYYIRKMFREIESRLSEPDLIVGDDKTGYIINTKYAEPVLVDSIGKKGDWISLRIFLDENNNTCVGIETSKSNHYTSNLLVKEFYAINDLIQHIDFANLEYNAVMLEMITMLLKNGGSRANTYATRPAYYDNRGYQRPQQPSYTGYAGTGYNSNYNDPYRNSGAAPQARPQQPRPAAPQQAQPQFRQTPLPPRASGNQQYQTPNKVEETPSSYPQHEEEEPTTKRPSINMSDMEKIPVEDESLSIMDPDDASYIDDIFGN